MLAVSLNDKYGEGQEITIIYKNILVKYSQNVNEKSAEENGLCS